MRTTRRAILLAVALSPAWPARAAKLEVQGPVVVDVREDGKSSTYAATLTVTATGPAAKVELEASPLAGEGAAAGSVIPAPNVTLGQLAFPAAGTRTVPITVASVPRPGTYSGTMALRGGDAPATFHLTFVLHPRVAVKPAVEAAAFSLLRCPCRPSCAVADFLAPNALEGDVRLAGIDSSTAETLHVDHVTASLDGEKTQTSLVVEGRAPGDGSQGPARKIVAGAGGPQVVVDLPAQVAKLSRSYATLTMARGRIAADRYRGAVRVFLREAEDPVVVPLTLDVRNGPYLAALVLLVGIALGRAVQARATPAAQLRAAAMDSYHQLESDIGRLADGRERTALGLDLRALRALIVAEPPDQAKIDALRSTIGKKISQLHMVHELQIQAGSGNAAFDTLARGAIDEILRGKDPAAIDEAIRELGESIRAPAPAPLAVSFAPLAVTKPRSFAQRVAAGVGVLAGTRWDLAEREYHLYRPMLGALLLVVLWLVGFQSLYVNGSGSFGSGGPWDYMPLFLWGMSVDIAQRTLLNLPAVKGS